MCSCPCWDGTETDTVWATAALSSIARSLRSPSGRGSSGLPTSRPTCAPYIRSRTTSRWISSSPSAACTAASHRASNFSITHRPSLRRLATPERWHRAISAANRSLNSSSEKQPIRRIATFVCVRITERRKEPLEFAHLPARHLHADQHPAVVASLIAVMEQADVPVGAHIREELHQRPGALGKLEPVKQLVGRAAHAGADPGGRVPPDHVAQD